MIIRLVGDNWVSADNLVCSVVDAEPVSKALVAIMKKLKIAKMAEYTLYLCNGGKPDFSRVASKDTTWKELGVAQGHCVYVSKKAPSAEAKNGDADGSPASGSADALAGTNEGRDRSPVVAAAPSPPPADVPPVDASMTNATGSQPPLPPRPSTFAHGTAAVPTGVPPPPPPMPKRSVAVPTTPPPPPTPPSTATPSIASTVVPPLPPPMPQRPLAVPSVPPPPPPPTSARHAATPILDGRSRSTPPPPPPGTSPPPPADEERTVTQPPDEPAPAKETPELAVGAPAGDASAVSAPVTAIPSPPTAPSPPPAVAPVAAASAVEFAPRANTLDVPPPPSVTTDQSSTSGGPAADEGSTVGRWTDNRPSERAADVSISRVSGPIETCAPEAPGATIMNRATTATVAAPRRSGPPAVEVATPAARHASSTTLTTTNAPAPAATVANPASTARAEHDSSRVQRPQREVDRSSDMHTPQWRSDPMLIQSLSTIAEGVESLSRRVSNLEMTSSPSLSASRRPALYDEPTTSTARTEELGGLLRSRETIASDAVDLLAFVRLQREGLEQRRQRMEDERVRWEQRRARGYVSNSQTAHLYRIL